MSGALPDTQLKGRISSLPPKREKPPEGGEEKKMKRLLGTLVVLSVLLFVFAMGVHAAPSTYLEQDNNKGM